MLSKSARHELRATAAAMAAVLASYGSTLLLEHLAELRIDVVVLSVVLSLTLSRTQRGAPAADRLLGLVLLPVAAFAAEGVGTLVDRHPDAGDALFVLCVCATVWIRRFGPHAARIGTVAVLPLVSILVLQGPVGAPAGVAHAGWVALVALIAAGWVLVVQVGAWRIGLGERAWPARRPEPAPQTAPQPAPGTAGARRLRPSTRMALQMATALGAAFMVGRYAYPAHWTWVVLTAFIVCSGARGRADVVHKGVLRGAGAALGTLVATWIAGDFGPGDRTPVVLIFVVLALATWLRKTSYAFWAAGVTSVLSLLYGYFGESAPALLRTRLLEILIGAVLGIAASWLVLPVRTSQVLRRRTADALAALSELLRTLAAEGPPQPGLLARRQAGFEHSVAQLDQLAPALEAKRFLERRLLPAPYQADAVDAVRRCLAPTRALVAFAAASDPAQPAQLAAAFGEIDGELRRLSAFFGPVPAAPAGR
ncbi:MULTISPECIES: FUSC family protein [Streptacidiphilus]|uniref:FUSC family protein n=1 Tax=Streptacidiphilus cavernicola TaxID=3342716 RepID=A0ABV6ULH0_9ACTN|nr:FUSC family protein [Streptacidiphilus jeojiense]